MEHDCYGRQKKGMEGTEKGKYGQINEAVQINFILSEKRECYI